MNVNFSRKELIKFLFAVYIPLIIISYIVTFKNNESLEVIGHFIIAGLFSYPTYLIVSLKIKRLLHWFFIGVLPFSTIYYLSSVENKNIDDLPGLFFLGIILSNIMYPLGLLGIKTFKDYWEMSKEMTLFGKIGLFLSLLFIIISIIKRLRW
jgi:hypothetical protein